MIQVPGLDGDVPMANNRRDNFPLTYNVGIKGDLLKMTRDIKCWLNASQGYRKLIDSRDKTYYSLVCFHAPKNGNKLGLTDKFPIIFDAKPYRYRFDGDIPISGMNTQLKNPETVTAYPIVTIYGNGNGTLLYRPSDYEGMSWGELPINNVNGSITLDFGTKNAYKQTEDEYGTYMVNMNKFVGELSDFSISEKYKNGITIQLSGAGFTNMEIKPRWRGL